MDRRDFVSLLGVGAAAAVAAGSSVAALDLRASQDAPRPPPLPEFPPPRPGPPSLVTALPPGTSRVALTVDDGYNQECVTGYVDFVVRTGIPLTFVPNGTYGPVWEAHADQLRPLVETGQIQFANHTYSHPDLRRLGDEALRKELVRNEEWIQRTFKTTSRPWFRPPYGAHDARTDEIAGELGFTKILMWTGDLGDAYPISTTRLLRHARQDLQPGSIVLGHANHRTVLSAFDELEQLLVDRGLEAATLDTAFGTSRMRG